MTRGYSRARQSLPHILGHPTGRMLLSGSYRWTSRSLPDRGRKRRGPRDHADPHGWTGIGGCWPGTRDGRPDLHRRDVTPRRERLVPSESGCAERRVTRAACSTPGRPRRRHSPGPGRAYERPALRGRRLAQCELPARPRRSAGSPRKTPTTIRIATGRRSRCWSPQSCRPVAPTRGSSGGPRTFCPYPTRPRGRRAARRTSKRDPSTGFSGTRPRA